jgi:cbb3-type cytochrome oxidase maturation protein
MNILYLLIGASLIAAFIFLWLFVWSVRSGQYDDTYTPSVRILFEDDEVKEEEQQEKDIVDEKPETK